MPGRTLVLLVAALLAACASQRSRSMPMAPGGSVVDFDRGGIAYSCAAAPESIGSTDWRRRPASAPSDAVEPIVAMSSRPGQPRALVAGPPLTGRLITDPDRIRAVQQALARRGYFRAPLDGLATDGLAEGLRRFQAAERLPVTGLLDGETARGLGLALPPAPSPARG